mgnify:CR=1 FL=1
MTRATDGASEPVTSLFDTVTGAIRKASSGIGEKMSCFALQSLTLKTCKTDKRATVQISLHGSPIYFYLILLHCKRYILAV